MMYRAYDLTSGWYGPIRETSEQAESDGRTERATYCNGEPVWTENQTNGAVRFMAPGEP
jgi:hypothetical protein